MITKHDLAEAQAAADQLFPELGSSSIGRHASGPTAREALDAFSKEAPAPNPSADIPTTAVQTAGASPAATLSDLLEAIRALHARAEIEVPLAIARMADDPYDILLALKQESGKLNDALYTLWLRHACASLKQ